MNHAITIEPPHTMMMGDLHIHITLPGDATPGDTLGSTIEETPQQAQADRPERITTPRRASSTYDDASVVIDRRTQLMWADTHSDRVTLDEAQRIAGQYNDRRHAGYDDWRVPTVAELVTLIDWSRHTPAIDANLFPDTKTDGWYLTSSPAPWAPESVVRVVGFNFGLVNDGRRGFRYWLRLVRPVSPSPGQ